MPLSVEKIKQALEQERQDKEEAAAFHQESAVTAFKSLEVRLGVREFLEELGATSFGVLSATTSRKRNYTRITRPFELWGGKAWVHADVSTAENVCLAHIMLHVAGAETELVQAQKHPARLATWIEEAKIRAEVALERETARVVEATRRREAVFAQCLSALQSGDWSKAYADLRLTDALTEYTGESYADALREAAAMGSQVRLARAAEAGAREAQRQSEREERELERAAQGERDEKRLQAMRAAFEPYLLYRMRYTMHVLDQSTGEAEIEIGSYILFSDQPDERGYYTTIHGRKVRPLYPYVFEQVRHTTVAHCPDDHPTWWVTQETEWGPIWVPAPQARRIEAEDAS